MDTRGVGTRESPSGHIPALDGLRAVAVLAVIAYHYEIGGLRGGFLGVDLFFVLSGFLITALLLREHDSTGTIGLGGFWARRIRRLLPASLVMIVVVAVWGWTQLPAHQLDRLRHDLLTTLGYVANWGFITSGQSYFDASTEPSPLRHVWSLAIEEQFYLVWPVVVLVMVRLARGRRWPLVSVAVLGSVASAAAMWLLHDPVDPSRAYYGTDTRAFQLLIGALLATAVVPRGESSTAAPLTAPSTALLTAPPRRAATALRSVVAVAGLAATLAAFALTTDGDEFMYRGGFVACSLVAAALVWSVSSGETVVARALSWRPLTAVGGVSYGLYLWHWPVQIAVSESRTTLSGWQLTAVRLAGTSVLAAISYRLVETPVRRATGWGRLPAWRLPAAAVAGAGAALALTFGVTAGAVDVPRYLAGEVGEIAVSDIAPSGSAALGAGRKQVLLIGDSVALSLEEGMAAEAAERGWSFSMVARWSCAVTDMAPLDHGCSLSRPDFLRRIAETDAPIIVWYSNWDGPLNFYDAFDDVEAPATALTASFRFYRLLDDTVTAITAGGADLYIVEPPQLASPGVNPAWDANIARARHVYGAYQRMRPARVSLLDLAATACPAGIPCPSTVDGVTLRPLDGAHYGPEGARWFAEWLFDRLEGAVSEPDPG